MKIVALCYKEKIKFDWCSLIIFKEEWGLLQSSNKKELDFKMIKINGVGWNNMVPISQCQTCKHYLKQSILRCLETYESI